MEFLVSTALFVVLVYLAIAVKTAIIKAKAPTPAKKAMKPAEDLQDADVVTTGNIKVNGTEKFISTDNSFVKQYGIKDKVLDIATVKNTLFSDTTDDIKECLKTLFAGGNTRGPDIAQYIFEDRQLSANESVYLVLTGSSKANLSVTAFVHSSH